MAQLSILARLRRIAEALPEMSRVAVRSPAEHADEFGHAHFSHYVEYVEEAHRAHVAKLGWSIDELRGKGFALRMRSEGPTSFQREIWPGSYVVAKARLTGVDGLQLTFEGELHSGAEPSTPSLAGPFIYVCKTSYRMALVRLADGFPSRWPEELVAAAEAKLGIGS